MNVNIVLYKTNFKGDFKRHRKSQKHQRNIIIYEQNNISEENLHEESTQKVHKKEQNFEKKGTKRNKRNKFK